LQAALKAGLVYFGIVFAAGFIFGAVRVTVLEPRVGAALAVIVEGPIILAVSWTVCRRLITRFSVPSSLAPRLAMGGAAFGLLIIAEVGLSLSMFGRTLAEHFAIYRNAGGVIGLAGQLVFGLFPVVQYNLRR